MVEARNSSLGLFLAVLVVSSGPARAEADQDGQARPPIVVEGNPQTRDEARQESREFVRQIGMASGQTPAARWIDPVCIAIVGLAPEFRPQVEGKLTEIARAAEVPLAQPGCSPNLAVVFTDDAAGVARQIGSQNPRATAEVAGSDREALYEGRAPVRWWYRIASRGRNGSRVGSVLPPWSSGEGAGGGSILPAGDDTTTLYGHDASLVSTQVLRGIERATVLIDTTEAEGKPLDAVVGFAAMVAFAEIRRNDVPPENSILGLFALAEPPGGPTARDIELLRVLYDLPLDRTARQHRARLVEGLVDAATGERP